jgi:outer membrane protein OmpA-like peptidoglycan-associated protein
MVAVSSTDIAKGLEASGKVALYGILFEFNKATIKPESRPTLDAVAKFLKEHPTQNIALTGHTDNIGGFEFNIRLSQMRAEAIAMDLSQTYGIEAGRMVTKGLGPQAPAASNDTEDGRAKNRRVELSVR